MGDLMPRVAVDEMLAVVDEDVARHLREARARAESAGTGAVALWDAVSEAASGGKRLRPRLLLDVHAALGGDQVAGARQVAAAFEILHTAFCVHDDVIDGDALRRGRPTVAHRYSEAVRTAGGRPGVAQAAGTGAGVLAGDLLITLAMRLVATTPLVDGPARGGSAPGGRPLRDGTGRGPAAAPGLRDALLDLVDDVVQRTAAGELDDVLAPAGAASVTLAEAVATASHKTAEYTFVGPVVAGAMLAGAEPALVDVLRRAARALGVAYQLADDLLGTFGDESVTGKSARGDLAEGKVTALVVLARDTPAWPELVLGLGDPEVTDAQAAHIRRTLEHYGVRAEAEELVELYTTTALNLLAAPIVPAPVRDALATHVDALEGRTR